MRKLLNLITGKVASNLLAVLVATALWTTVLGWLIFVVRWVGTMLGVIV